MKKCFEREHICVQCNGIRVLAAIDFYNSNPKPGDLYQLRKNVPLGGVYRLPPNLSELAACNIVLVKQEKENEKVL